MKKLFLILSSSLLLATTGIFAQGPNVKVINTAAQPVPVTGSISATTAPNTITTATAANVAVTATSGTALAANAARKDAVLVNYGATGCFLRRGTPATAGTGIYLAPSGGAYNIDQNNLYTGIITVITASSTTTLAVSEGQ